MISKFQQEILMNRRKQKEAELKKSVSVPLQKLHMELDERGRPKIKVDDKYTPKPEQKTDMSLILPYNNTAPKSVLQEIKAPIQPMEANRSELDHQKTRNDLLKPIEILQLEVLQQMLEELKKLNGNK